MGSRWAVSKGETKPAPIKTPEDLPDAAVAPVAPRYAFRKRVATSLAFSVLFFAGAAFTAGAGNQLAQVDDLSTPAPTVVDTATAPAVTDETAPVPAAVDPAPAEDPPMLSRSARASPPWRQRRSRQLQPQPRPGPGSPFEPARLRAGAGSRGRRPHAMPVQAPLAPIPFEAIAFNPHAWLARQPGVTTGASAVAIAQHYLGVPYRWGGAVPASGFDCSGLTRFVYAQLGINLPHYAASQFAAFAKLDPADLQPGDLVFFEPTFDGPGHVALYLATTR